MSAKRIIALSLGPLIRITDGAMRRLARLWAYARLYAALPAGLDPSTVVHGMPEVHGSRRIHLGRDLFLYRDLYFETRGDGEITIGDGCVLSRGVHLVAHCAVVVGAGTLIGEYTSIRDANHRFGVGIAPRRSGHCARPIRIGSNVWIGRGVTILQGVTIGDGAVIGANAVVSNDIAPHTVAVGVPARPLARLHAAA